MVCIWLVSGNPAFLGPGSRALGANNHAGRHAQGLLTETSEISI